VSKKKPVYLLAGGRGNNDPTPLFQSVLKDIGKASPTIAYVGAASGDNKDFLARMESMIQSAAKCKIVFAPFVGKANVEKSKGILESSDAVFVSGGDVEPGMQILEEKGVTGIFSKLYEEGKLFFGISAGSIMLAREWVRWTDPDDDSTAELFPCLGIAPVMCDTHGEGDDWEELKAALMLKKAGAVGYGITSGTCLKTFSTGDVEELGGSIYRYARVKDGVRRQADIMP